MSDPALLSPSAVDIPAPEHHTAEVLDAATEPGQEIRCVVPSLDSLLATDPMPWAPYSTPAGWFYPKKGDAALLAYPTDGPPWIVQWQPNATEPDVIP